MKIIKCYSQSRKIDEFEILLNEFCKMEEAAKKIYYEKYHDSRSSPPPREIQREVQKICVDKFKKNYESCRSKLAQLIPVMQQIANELKINTKRVGQAPMVLGGSMYMVDIFHSLLEQFGYIELESSIVFDELNKMKGLLRESIKKEWLNIANPLTWISALLRIPFLLIKQTGFNIDKIENELWGKIIKIFCLILLLWGILRLGFTHEQIVNFFEFKFK